MEKSPIDLAKDNTMLYELKEDDRNFQQVYLDDDAMMLIITEIDAQSENNPLAPITLSDAWPERVTGEFHQDSDDPQNDLIPDISFWYRYFLISDKALTPFKKSLGENCEFLPVETDQGQYHLLNIKQMTQCITKSSDKPKIFKSDQPITKLPSVMFETLDDEETYIATLALKKAVEEANLTGLQFITRSQLAVV